ncbi:hypothetical protein THRCLA_20762 [Thraustotheca clavata]|uniref:Uncharacterized protein n=1 Tax=Thraustotheca clavata TaxID=74557 RepID=A0A1W0A3V1_9STRA|nr:hypothetical protein THRCLA_20762 [Thraustotheca clavata]
MEGTAVDYFSLHSRKKREVDIEMLDYEFVNKCNDVELLKNILAVLQSGKEGRYPHLEQATQNQLLKSLPKAERERIDRMQVKPTISDIDNERRALANWELEMENKSTQLEMEAQQVNKAARSRPAVRGRPNDTPQEKAPVKAPLIQELTEQTKTKKAIPAYDWRAWEKYDVEQAEKELELKEERKAALVQQQKEEIEKQNQRRLQEASMPLSVDLESLTLTEREVYALNEKNKGNECFKLGENDSALLYYSRSLAYDPKNAIVYANRALTHLRLKNFAKAEDDCTQAIALDASYFKAWSRRGMTRFRRGKYAEAITDFKTALRLDPGNREIEKLLKKTEEKWLEVDGTRGGTIDNTPAPFQRFEIIEEDSQKNLKVEQPRPTQQQSFKRFEIIEDDDEDDDDDESENIPNEKPFQRFEILED